MVGGGAGAFPCRTGCGRHPLFRAAVRSWHPWPFTVLHTGGMAKTYQGPATVIAPGLAIAVEADLRVEYQTFETVNDKGWVIRERGLREWLGSIQADPDESFWELFGKTLQLRLPDGREGNFRPGESIRGTGRMEIHGAGPAPFWDEADEPTS